MDELIIDEKKYVSTKRAAKETGYAKDYVGQLCREGRVPARLVGRSWYVLASAIQDHRFGAPHESAEAPEVPVIVSSTLPPTWEAPKYKADSGTEIPSVSRINKLQEVKDGSAIEESVPVSLHDAWQEWFSTQQTPKEAVPVSQEGALESEDESEEEEGSSENIIEQHEDEEGGWGREEDAVDIPIHTFYEPQIAVERPRIEEQSSRPAPVYPRAEERLQGESLQKLAQIRRGGARRGLVATSIGVVSLVAVVLMVITVIGSGYLDRYVISVGPASTVSGIDIYNR